MITLGIETSCDETAASIYDGQKILSNIVLSQTELHKEFGGVYPELAARRHLDFLIFVVDKALKDANLSKSDIELIAVASSPGLIGALLMGVNCAKALGFALDVPVIGVNHVEAHLFANFIDYPDEIEFPALGLIISGGHTALLYLEDKKTSKVLGTTLDDAIGECFDKVARMLELPYPGGPQIEKLAKQGNSKKFNFKPPRVKDKPYHFSYSGLKTKVLYTVYGQDGSDNLVISKKDFADVAASFQEAAFTALIKAVNYGADNLPVKSLLIGGGVSASSTLKERLEKEVNPEIKVYYPKPLLSLDNAAMIAALGYHRFQTEGESRKDFTASPSSKSHSYLFCYE